MSFKHYLRIVIIYGMATLISACNDEFRVHTPLAKIEIIDSCRVRFVELDSMDVYMRFIDKENRPLVDAYIIKRISQQDGQMSFDARLKESDQWKIDKITDKHGHTHCASYFCGMLDSTEISCKTANIFPGFLPVDSVQMLKVICHCRSEVF